MQEETVVLAEGGSSTAAALSGEVLGLATTEGTVHVDDPLTMLNIEEEETKPHNKKKRGRKPKSGENGEKKRRRQGMTSAQEAIHGEGMSLLEGISMEGTVSAELAATISMGSSSSSSTSTADSTAANGSAAGEQTTAATATISNATTENGGGASEAAEGTTTRTTRQRGRRRKGVTRKPADQTQQAQGEGELAEQGGEGASGRSTREDTWRHSTLVSPKKGKFTLRENELLLNSIRSFCAAVGLGIEPDDVAKFVSLDSYREYRGCWKEIAKALPDRSVQSCYDHARRTFNRHVNTGPYTEEEENTLKRLLEEHGHNYAEIAREMGRDRISIRDKVRNLKSIGSEKQHGGRWDPWETEKLKALVQEAMGDEPLEQVPMGGDFWVEIAKKLGTRNFNQCRSHWNTQVSPLLAKEEWTPLDDWELLQSLVKCGYEVKQDIVWSEVAQGLKWTAHQCYARWHRLVKMKLPDLSPTMAFDETLDKMAEALEPEKKEYEEALQRAEERKERRARGELVSDSDGESELAALKKRKRQRRRRKRAGLPNEGETEQVTQTVDISLPMHHQQQPQQHEVSLVAPPIGEGIEGAPGGLTAEQMPTLVMPPTHPPEPVNITLEDHHHHHHHHHHHPSLIKHDDLPPELSQSSLVAHQEALASQPTLSAFPPLHAGDELLH
ncbi:hypothetical protein QOT17_010729 [Balamuthia mandrillaris]